NTPPRSSWVTPTAASSTSTSSRWTGTPASRPCGTHRTGSHWAGSEAGAPSTAEPFAVSPHRCSGSPIPATSCHRTRSPTSSCSRGRRPDLRIERAPTDDRRSGVFAAHEAADQLLLAAAFVDGAPALLADLALAFGERREADRAGRRLRAVVAD